MSRRGNKHGGGNLAKRGKYLVKFRATSKALDGAIFPILERPNVPKGASPTLELIHWAVRFYCFSILSHFRELLRSFLCLIDNGHIPAAFVVGRSLFEMGANSYYVHKHVMQYLKSKDLSTAWKFLSKINMGNRYMRSKKDDKEVDFPEPGDIGKAVHSFNEWGKLDLGSMYSYLSEYSHPNMAAYSHYYEFKLDPEKKAKVTFVEVRRDPLVAPLPEVSVSVQTVLNFVQKLLVSANEDTVAVLIDRTLRKYIREGS